MRKSVRYEEALVTYLDILGFRELVRTESAGRISRTIRLVRDALRPSHDRAKLYQMTYQSFSDLTVVSITEEFYEQKVLPRLATISASAIARQISVSR